MHLELGLEESRIRYEAGDHVAIYPTNDLQLVNKIGQLLEIDLDTVFTMKALDEDATKKSPFPVPTTYRTALKHYVRVHHMLSRILKFSRDCKPKFATDKRPVYDHFLANFPPST